MDVAGRDKLGAPTRAEAKGAEMKISDERNAEPLVFPVRWRRPNGSRRYASEGLNLPSPATHTLTISSVLSLTFRLKVFPES